MKIFGLSVWLIIFILVAFYLGAKNPGWLARIPILNNM